METTLTRGIDARGVMKCLLILVICTLVAGCQPRCTSHFGEHTWGPWVQDQETGTQYRKCLVCGWHQRKEIKVNE